MRPGSRNLATHSQAACTLAYRPRPQPAMRYHTIRTSLTTLSYCCPRWVLCFRQHPEHSCRMRGTDNAPYPQVESRKLGRSQRHDFCTSTHAHKEMPYGWGQSAPSMYALSSPDRTLVPSCACGSQQLSQGLRPFLFEKGGRYVHVPDTCTRSATNTPKPMAGLAGAWGRRETDTSSLRLT